MNYLGCRIENITMNSCVDDKVQYSSELSLSPLGFDRLLQRTALEIKANGMPVVITGDLVYDGFEGLRFTFVVDALLSCGPTLADRMNRLADFWLTESGEQHARLSNLSASMLSSQYRKHYLVLFEAARSELAAEVGSGPK